MVVWFGPLCCGGRSDKPAPPEKGKVADVPLYVTCYKDHIKVGLGLAARRWRRVGVWGWRAVHVNPNLSETKGGGGAAVAAGCPHAM